MCEWWGLFYGKRSSSRLTFKKNCEPGSRLSDCQLCLLFSALWLLSELGNATSTFQEIASICNQKLLARAQQKLVASPCFWPSVSWHATSLSMAESAMCGLWRRRTSSVARDGYYLKKIKNCAHFFFTLSLFLISLKKNNQPVRMHLK